MTALRQPRWFSATIACAIAVAWLLATNHCAFATIAAHSAKAAHACCHEEDAPHPSAPQSMQCCDALKASLPAQAVVPAASLSALLPDWTATEVLPRLVAVENLRATPATGPPPRAESFAEIVLNRSLPALAPPVFVA
jgi:hypothetical protein